MENYEATLVALAAKDATAMMMTDLGIVILLRFGLISCSKFLTSEIRFNKF